MGRGKDDFLAARMEKSAGAGASSRTDHSCRAGVEFHGVNLIFGSPGRRRLEDDRIRGGLEVRFYGVYKTQRLTGQLNDVGQIFVFIFERFE